MKLIFIITTFQLILCVLFLQFKPQKHDIIEIKEDFNSIHENLFKKFKTHFGTFNEKNCQNIFEVLCLEKKIILWLEKRVLNETRHKSFLKNWNLVYLNNSKCIDFEYPDSVAFSSIWKDSSDPNINLHELRNHYQALRFGFIGLHKKQHMLWDICSLHSNLLDLNIRSNAKILMKSLFGKSFNIISDIGYIRTNTTYNKFFSSRFNSK